MLNQIKQFARFLPQRHHIRAATLVVLGILALWYASQGFALWRNARQLAAVEPQLEEALVSRDLKAAQTLLANAQRDAEDIQGALRNLYPFTVLPPFNREAQAAKKVLAAGNIMLESGLRVIEWLGSVPLLQKEGDFSYHNFTDQEKREFLVALAASKGLWKETRKHSEFALALLENARAETRFLLVSGIITSASDKLWGVIEKGRALEPWLAVLPGVLGYPEPKTYLLLLQNNTELRPTGGFIGTFGHVSLSGGAITDFQTENVYNLDEPAKAFNEKIPPEPLQRYLRQSQWFFRDSNWDPDFPTSAERALQFYRDERGPIQRFDGVIAFTPRLIQDVLAVTGPISVGDVTFTAENLVETLAYHVELGFREEGITLENRKQVIDDLAQELKTRLFSLDAAEIRAFLPRLLAALSQKQLMLYFKDGQAQSVVANAEWDNRIRESSGDYVYVVDANLGSLKSDPAILRTIGYTLSPQPGGALRATVSITYRHTAGFDWKTTRYRTYTRLYVPLGSKFVSAAGNEERVSVGDEHSKTVFGTFISIEPNTSETLVFTYELPTALSARISESGYTLLVQKQGGTPAHALEFNITLPSGSRLVRQWNLEQDRIITIDAGGL